MVKPKLNRNRRATQTNLMLCSTDAALTRYNSMILPPLQGRDNRLLRTL
jgi:hypothetical protein